ncbi:hypothetical protein CCP3SC1AL1_110031 [Gammaproteobacteria bacterium]
MSIKCFPLAGEQNYTVGDFQAYLGSRIQGVYATEGNLAVTAKSPAAMAVLVSGGLAWLLTGEMKGVTFNMSAGVELPVEAADPLQARIDTVVVGLDKVNRVGYCEVVKGLVGGGATPPVRDASYYELVLAEIAVPAAAASITADKITDKRPDDTVCGYMRDIITPTEIDVINNLTSDSTTDALSAAMGKELASRVSMAGTPGMVAFFAQASAPSGWLICDGTTKNRVTYAALFAAIGTLYNIGGESGSEFRLPDMTGRFLRGTGGSAAALGTKQADAFQGHEHIFSMPGPFTPGDRVTTTSGNRANLISNGVADDGVHGTPRVASETRPINYGMTPCIKY